MMSTRLKSAIAALMVASAPPVGAQTIQTVCSFNLTNGASPSAPLTLCSDANFYGTTYFGGRWGFGTVFQVTTNGALTTLVSFEEGNGANPTAGLTLGTDGNFYSTTESGGIANYPFLGSMGTAFRMTTNGVLTTLVFFCQTNGANPTGGLALGTDGNFYGVTKGGGTANSDFPDGMGTVFRMTTNGALTTLFLFSPTNGANPTWGLTLGTDGNFYGTTYSGGMTNSAHPSGMGTVFRVMTNGTLTTLVYFSGTNGGWPNGPLTLGADGSLYGTTYFGGISNSTSHIGMGTVFRVATNGVLDTLVYFSGTNGAYPLAALTLGTDGNFYGTTSVTGPTAGGTAFQMTPNGTLTTLVNFSGTNGASPQAALTLGTDGALYGTTYSGGASNYGTVFRLLLSPFITIQPQSQTNNAGVTATFSAKTTGVNPMAYQWQKNGTNLVDGGNISGSTGSVLTIAGISDNDAASYSVIVSNFYGRVTSCIATLMVVDPPVITVPPTNLLVLPGPNAAFSVSVAGTAPFRYQWRFNGTNLLNATNASYTIASVGTNNAGNYSVVVTNAAGRTTSSNAALTVVLSPMSRTNYAGSTASFTVRAFSPEPLHYQWQRNGSNLVEGGRLWGTTNSTLTIANVSGADAASYSTVVSDATGSVATSNAMLTVNDHLFIASQPQTQTVGLGSNVTFTVMVYGAPPFLFQWYFNGTPVGAPTTGTNVSSYSLASVSSNQAGNYSVQVVNGYGSVTSSNAVLAVKAFPPRIELQPLSQTVMIGSNASFSLSVSGTPPFYYQWRFNGASIPNASNAVYAIHAVGATDTGNYSVVVTNVAGSATSSNAWLTVIVPPTLGLQLSAGYPLLNLNGMLRSNFVVQYSTNLTDVNWTDLLFLTNLPTSPYLFLDPAGNDEPAKFYRALMY